MSVSEKGKELSDRIASLCYEHFNKLPKKGKPQERKEWTMLAAVVLKIERETAKYDLQVVALGTGSKCVGQGKITDGCGDVLHDSHAEVIARRAFLRYLYHQIDAVYQGQKSDIFTLNTISKKCWLKEHASFIFFSTHTPCGDGSIIPMECVEMTEDSGTINEYYKEPPKKIPRMDEPDLYRTGAKCVHGGPQDPKLPGMEHHLIGILRTKPGRGDQTLSMSCSDKLAKWNILGIQGSLLMNFLMEPIYFSDIVIGKCPYSNNAMYRALIQRFQNSIDRCIMLPFKQQNVKITQSSLEFQFGKPELGGDHIQPCPSSIIWCDCPSKPLEVSVEGRKQGVTKKTQRKPSSRLGICRKNLFQTFGNLLMKMNSDEMPSNLRKCVGNIDNMTYHQVKQLSSEYCLMWKDIREKVMPTWTLKPPNLNEFTIKE